MAQTLFGFQIGPAKDRLEDKEKTFALPANDDGAVTVQSGGYYATYVDLDGVVRNEIELITRYREMAMQPELETAIDEIIDEAITHDDDGRALEINVEDIEAGTSVKEAIKKEFDNILRMLDFQNLGHDIFRRWYIDGRLYYHVIIDENRPADGIKGLRYIDPRRIRKIREVTRTKDPKTGIDIISKEQEYYLYNDRGILGQHTNLGSKIAKDSIVNVSSGLMDAKRAMVISYLHKAIRPLNQVRMMEDATVIYRLSRAPERRVFYIDVGNMSTIKAEQYLRNIVTKYRNKITYDSTTGEVRDDRRHLSMLEDFWLPRREGSTGTQITTLPGGQNLGEMQDVKYFEQKLYKSLGVPISRLETQSGFSLGRTTEITRDELRFNKFIKRLRSRFSSMFDMLLRTQLVLKKVCTVEEWEEFKEKIWYNFRKDNNFDELKESELNNTRFDSLMKVDAFVGKYYSINWIRKNILKLSDDDIKSIDAENAENAKMMQQQQPSIELEKQPTGLQEGAVMELAKKFVVR